MIPRFLLRDPKHDEKMILNSPELEFFHHSEQRKPDTHIASSESFQ
jgi:hypothetical protein